jgi:REP element-mobilizing transposase RayT
MGHRYAATFFHCVFSTKHRVPEIREPERLWSYLLGIARNHKIEMQAVGGTKDHVHLIVTPPSTMPISEAVQKLKSNSSRWLRENQLWSGWQEGYGVFSVSPTALPSVKEYIRIQGQHHARRNSREEFLMMLRQAGVPVSDEVE